MDSVYKTINGEKVSIVCPYLKFSHKQPTERTHFQRLGKYKMELDIFVRFFVVSLQSYFYLTTDCCTKAAHE